MGRNWEDKPEALPIELEDEDVPNSNYSNLVLVAVHRSPTLMPYQERILLTAYQLSPVMVEKPRRTP